MKTRLRRTQGCSKVVRIHHAVGSVLLFALFLSLGITAIRNDLPAPSSDTYETIPHYFFIYCVQWLALFFTWVAWLPNPSCYRSSSSNNGHRRARKRGHENRLTVSDATIQGPGQPE